MIANQTRITGPNIQPTAPVPYRWTANRPTRIASEIGTTRCGEARGRDLEALDRRGHRDRRGDHAVAEEQPRAEQPQGHQRRGPRHLAALDQRAQGHDPAVTAVVGAHDEPGVLDRDLDDQRPEDERRDAVDAGDRRAGRVGVLGEDRLDGVERAGPEVPVDDAQGAQRQDQLAGVGDHVALVIGRGADRRRRAGVLLGARLLGDRPVTELVGRLVEVALDSARGPAGVGAVGGRSLDLVGALGEGAPTLGGHSAGGAALRAGHVMCPSGLYALETSTIAARLARAEGQPGWPASRMVPPRHPFHKATFNSPGEAVPNPWVRPDVAMAACASLGVCGFDLAPQVGDVGAQDLRVVGVTRAPHRRRAARGGSSAGRGCAPAAAAGRTRWG